ncbi:hypothetical protein [Candidatus Viridilinea mediisalina]|uniref:Uncharacterized protein n=1 Tax=Candidatus Viridilinea mediisalina TaxID=2024553 RepID=A0A2A6RE70_9CHLR|nr:hypothetical protein [Candidatus Viridilinea mediisalina]PDW00527.1 hypothetical protein CJ255_20620 [Candidatus Viridilinea mediisalina]
MYAVEFEVKTKDGTIEIPLQYRNKVRGVIRVIILVEEEQPEMNMIAHLMKNPIQAPNFKPMNRSEIYDR